MVGVGQPGERWNYERYRSAMKSKTRDTSAYRLPYLRGLLRLESKRNMVHIAWETKVTEQNLQQFVSDSP